MSRFVLGLVVLLETCYGQNEGSRPTAYLWLHPTHFRQSRVSLRFARKCSLRSILLCIASRSTILTLMECCPYDIVLAHNDLQDSMRLAHGVLHKTYSPPMG